MKYLFGFTVYSIIIAVVLLSAPDLFAASKSITTLITVTVRSPDQAQVPKGLEDLYNVALAQNLSQRIVKVEAMSTMPNSMPRYSMTERL